jgi:hypothetical protein
MGLFRLDDKQDLIHEPGLPNVGVVWAEGRHVKDNVIEVACLKIRFFGKFRDL